MKPSPRDPYRRSRFVVFSPCLFVVVFTFNCRSRLFNNPRLIRNIISYYVLCLLFLSFYAFYRIVQDFETAVSLLKLSFLICCDKSVNKSCASTDDLLKCVSFRRYEWQHRRGFLHSETLEQVRTSRVCLYAAPSYFASRISRDLNRVR